MDYECVESLLLIIAHLRKFHTIEQDLSNKMGYFAPSEFAQHISWTYFDIIINQQHQTFFDTQNLTGCNLEMYTMEKNSGRIYFLKRPGEMIL